MRILGLIDIISFLILIGKVGYLECEPKASVIPVVFWGIIVVVITYIIIKTYVENE